MDKKTKKLPPTLASPAVATEIRMFLAQKGCSFSGYALEAIQEKMQRDGFVFTSQAAQPTYRRGA